MKRAVIGAACLLGFLVWFPAAVAQTEVVFGPKVYERMKGKPVTVVRIPSRSADVTAGPFTLRNPERRARRGFPNGSRARSSVAEREECCSRPQGLR